MECRKHRQRLTKSMSKKYTCICIDDDRIYTELMEKFIEKIDFIELIGTYNNPIEGVMALDKHSPDLLFLDVEMPQINAFDTIAALDVKPAIVIVSSHWEHEEKLLAAGATKFVTKPIRNVQHLEEIAKDALGID